MMHHGRALFPSMKSFERYRWVVQRTPHFHLHGCVGEAASGASVFGTTRASRQRPMARVRKKEDRGFGYQTSSVVSVRREEPISERLSVRIFALGFSRFVRAVSVTIASRMRNRYKRGRLLLDRSSALGQFNPSVLVMGRSRLARVDVEAKLSGYSRT